MGQRSMDIPSLGGAIPGLGQDAKWPSHVTNQIDGIILHTADPNLIENGLPEYPPLPSTTESHKVNEIRRTVVFDNLDTSVTAEQVMEIAKTAGEVKYLRLGVDCDEADGRNALVEYSEQPSIVVALALHHTDFMGRPIKVNHSTSAIVKPQTKSNEAAQREIEEAMRRVKEAQNFINSAIDPVMSFLDGGKEKRSRSRSRRSRSRRKSRSKSRDKSRRRTRSRSRSKRSRSRSRKKRSRSKSRGKSSRKSKARSRSRSKSKSRSHRSRSRSKSRRDKDKEKSSKRDK